MRTTLTIESDIAIELERLRKRRDVGLKEIVNELLRRALRDINAQKKRKPFRAGTFKISTDSDFARFSGVRWVNPLAHDR